MLLKTMFLTAIGCTDKMLEYRNDGDSKSQRTLDL